MANGEHQAFRHEWKPLPKAPEDWTTHPRTGLSYPGEDPWWRVEHLDIETGDIKEVWEPARFAWLYDLARAFALTGDSRYASAAADSIEGWDEACPAFEGVHWSCGQETAIRAFALMHAEAVMSPAWDHKTRVRVERVLGASGERIADAIGYAISQRNNHAVSEAAGLVALGVRLRGAHAEAALWLKQGHALLERLVCEQFAPDGWYIQHSFVYMRLALEQCALAEMALRAVGLRLGDAAAARIRAATALLLALVDADNGDVPNHGANDGAFVWPTTMAPFRDFRPVVTATSALWELPVPTDVPVDMERLAWMGLPPPPAAPPRGDGVAWGVSGWAVARVGRTVAFLRSGSYTSRPAHLDALHLDVRYDGEPVVVDPGTFSYNAPHPWRNGLASGAVHNGPLLDGEEPGVKGPRFLWYLWPRARISEAKMLREQAVMVGERGGVVRRSVIVHDGSVRVEDLALDPEAETLSVLWTLGPAAPADTIEVEGGTTQTAREGDVLGWISPHYGQRIPSRVVSVNVPSDTSRPVVTRIALRSDEPPSPRSPDGRAVPSSAP